MSEKEGGGDRGDKELITFFFLMSVLENLIHDFSALEDNNIILSF